MEKSETIGKLTLALSKVQSQLRPAKENSKNPFFKSSYADLGSVWDSGVGSAISYARRYALASIVGVVTGDDDGNMAVKGSSPKSTTNSKSTPKPKLTDSQYKGMMKAIEEGKGSVVEQKMGGYTLTKTQQDNLSNVLKLSKTLM